MELPYYILLIPYLIGVIIFLLWVAANLYHMIKFGLFDFTGKLNTFLFLGFTLIIMIVTVLLLLNVDWTATFDPFSADISLPFTTGSDF